MQANRALRPASPPRNGGRPFRRRHGRELRTAPAARRPDPAKDGAGSVEAYQASMRSFLITPDWRIDRQERPSCSSRCRRRLRVELASAQADVDRPGARPKIRRNLSPPLPQVFACWLRLIAASLHHCRSAWGSMVAWSETGS